MMGILFVLMVLGAGSIAQAADMQSAFRAVVCEITYPHHLQGVCTDEKESIFWGFATNR